MKAKVTITPDPRTATVEIPFVSTELLEEMRRSSDDVEAVADMLELSGSPYTRSTIYSQEVGVLLQDVSPGTSIRKPFGTTHYLRADDSFARREGAISGEQIVMICDGYRVSLWDGSDQVVVRLSDLIGVDDRPY